MANPPRSRAIRTLERANLDQSALRWWVRGRHIAWWTATRTHQLGRANATRQPPALALLCIYRSRNDAVVAELIASLPTPWTPYLWALDEVSPALEEHTVGVGAGLRTELLNQLHEHAESQAPETWIAIADDDISFLRHSGGLAECVRYAEASQFDLCQPAHGFGSTTSHLITWCHLASVSRLTTFVEIGPLVIIAPSLRSAIFPMPVSYGMGLGLEADWMSLVDDGYRLGVIDRCPLIHHGSIGGEYDNRAGVQRFRQEIGKLGTYRELVRTLDVWRPWHAAPPWS